MGRRRVLLPRSRADASPELLNELASSEYSFVREAVAGHPATRADTLRCLVPGRVADERAASIVRALVRNPGTPADVLGDLANLILPQLGDPRDRPWAFDVGVSLCANPNTPHKTVEAIIDSPRAVTQFRKVVARETSRSDVLAVLRSDRSAVVRRATDKNGHRSLSSISLNSRDDR